MTLSLPSSLNGSCGIAAVDVRGRGEHELAAEAAREIECVLGAAVVDLQRVDRLAVARDLECREVDDRGERAIEAGERGGVRDVGLDEAEARIAAEFLEVVEPAHR